MDSPSIATTAGVVLLAVLAGGAVGVLLALHLTGWRRRSVREERCEQPTARIAPVLPHFRRSVAVVDPSMLVVAASPDGALVDLVPGREVEQPPLRAAARAALDAADGHPPVVRDVLSLGRLASTRTHVEVRASRLADGNVLLDVEDRSEALRVEAVRRDFVVNVSHELKTPVGAIALLAETVADAADDPGAVTRFAGRMREECERLSRLVADIIQLNRVQGIEGLTGREPIDVDGVVAEALDEVRPHAERAGIGIAVGRPSRASVLGDRGQVLTAVRNLLVNAVTYSPAGTRVGTAVRLREDIIEVVVTDRGIGIPLADQERVFERFYRVDPARSRATGGTGLGLSIVKHVAENHGGEVSLWSRPGQGSTFTLRLPVQPGSVATPPATRSTPAARSSGTPDPGTSTIATVSQEPAGGAA